MFVNETMIKVWYVVGSMAWPFIIVKVLFF